MLRRSRRYRILAGLDVLCLSQLLTVYVIIELYNIFSVDHSSVGGVCRNKYRILRDRIIYFDAARSDPLVKDITGSGRICRTIFLRKRSSVDDILRLSNLRAIHIKEDNAPLLIDDINAELIVICIFISRSIPIGTDRDRLILIRSEGVCRNKYLLARDRDIDRLVVLKSTLLDAVDIHRKHYRVQNVTVLKAVLRDLCQSLRRCQVDGGDIVTILERTLSDLCNIGDIRICDLRYVGISHQSASGCKALYDRVRAILVHLVDDTVVRLIVIVSAHRHHGSTASERRCSDLLAGRTEQYILQLLAAVKRIIRQIFYIRCRHIDRNDPVVTALVDLFLFLCVRIAIIIHTAEQTGRHIENIIGIRIDLLRVHSHNLGIQLASHIGCHVIAICIVLRIDITVDIDRLYACRDHDIRGSLYPGSLL